MHIFITYGDCGFEAAKEKIAREACATNEFDAILSLGRDDLSVELMHSDIINIKRGGGLWSWKPDVILTTMEKYDKGDIIVYCDAGCSLYASSEWKKYWKELQVHDIIAQRMYHPTYKWTRKELIEYFTGNQQYWDRMCQYMATVIILKISDFTIDFVKEWRDIMINHSYLAMDVEPEKLDIQQVGFIQNRHDQAVYSALIYKYANNINYKGKIKYQWEHVDYYDPIFRQAIRATRLRNGEKESLKQKYVGAITRLVKDYILRPVYYGPKQWYYSNK